MAAAGAPPRAPTSANAILACREADLRMGALALRAGRRGEPSIRGVARGGGRARETRWSGRTARTIPENMRPAGARPNARRRRPGRRRGRPSRFARAMVRRVELPPRGVLDLRRLVALKEKQKLTISLVMQNDRREETIGRRPPAFREMSGVPLLDEIMFSTRSPRIARGDRRVGGRAGRPPQLIAPRLGQGQGRGALNRYTDHGRHASGRHDLRNWHRGVYGTLDRSSTSRASISRPLPASDREAACSRRAAAPLTELSRASHHLVYPNCPDDPPLPGYAGRRSLLETIRSSPVS